MQNIKALLAITALFPCAPLAAAQVMPALSAEEIVEQDQHVPQAPPPVADPGQ